MTRYRYLAANNGTSRQGSFSRPREGDAILEPLEPIRAVIRSPCGTAPGRTVPAGISGRSTRASSSSRERKGREEVLPPGRTRDQVHALKGQQHVSMFWQV